MTPEAIVGRQLDAYNDRDLERFMACWAKDARIYAWPETLLAEDAGAIEVQHRERFADTTLRATLLSRTSVGELVIDREIVTRHFDGLRGTVDVMGIYEVCDGLIRRAWFKQSPVRPPEA